MPSTLSLLANPIKNADPKSATDGFKYEKQLLLLFIVKAMLQKVDFKVTSNVKGFGAFDDLVSECKFLDGSKKLICVQAKHKKDVSKWKLDKDLLLGIKCTIVNERSINKEDNTYKVEKYYKSVQESSLQNALQNEEYMDVEYVLFTNVETDNTVEWDKNVSAKSIDLLNTSGSITKIDHNKNHTILNKIDASNRENFLTRLIFLTNEKSVDDMPYEILRILQILLKTNDMKYLMAYYDLLFNEIEQCYETFTPITNLCFEKMQKIAVQEICYAGLNKHIRKLSEEYKFDCNVISTLRSQIEASNQTICLRTQDKNTLLTSIKVYQALRHNKNFLFVNNQDLSKIFLLIERQKGPIVVDCDQISCESAKTITEMVDLLVKHGNTKVVFLVTKDNALPCLTQIQKIDVDNNFVHFDAETRASMLNRNVTIQGHRVNLMTLVSDCVINEDEIKYEITEQLLKKQQIVIGTEIKDLDNIMNCYINRYLHLVTIDPKAFRCLNENNIFFINSSDLSTLKLNNFMLYPELVLKDTNIILCKTRIEGHDLKLAFNKTCKFLETGGVIPTKNIHFLTYESEQFVWLFTKGDIKELQKYVISDEEKQELKSSEDDFIKNSCNRKVCVVVDKAGMGKTTLLKYLAEAMKKCDSKNWVFYYDLNSINVTEKLSNMKDSNSLNFPNVIDVLKTEFLSLKTSLELQLFEKMNIILCLDGFDELKNEYLDVLTIFVQKISQIKNIQIYMTSRENEKQKLEQSLSTLASHMLLFSEENQKEFLYKYFKTLSSDVSGESTELKIAIFTTELLASFTKINKNILDFTGIPMLIKMLAIINSENFFSFLLSESSSYNISAVFASLTDLYDTFIIHHLKRYLEEKESISKFHNKFDDRLQQISNETKKSHQLFAMKSLSQQYCIELTGDEEIIVNNSIKNKASSERFGIVCIFNKDDIKFLHLTLAEYFVATHIAQKLLDLANQNKQERINTISNFGNILLTPGSLMVRKFLEPLIGEVKNNMPLLRPEVLYYTTNKQSLHLNSRENNYNICELIIKSIPNTRSNVLRYLPILGLLKPHTDRKTYVNSKNEGGETSLMFAADLGHTDILSLLIENGGDVNIRYCGYSTALMRAACDGFCECILLLLKYGANINDTNDDGDSALHIAVREEKIETCKILLDNGADVLIRNEFGLTALHEAAIKKNVDACTLLLNNGANVNIQSKDGNTALHEAVKMNNITICQFLLDKGANLNVQNNDKCTALHLSIRYYKYNACKFLIDKGADKNIQNKDGHTPLQLALKLNRVRYARMLN